jgi:asparaginyl-tRNA synthetase
VDDPETYPIQPKAHSLEFLREVAHLRPRTNLFGAVTRIRHCLAQAVHRFFHEEGFYWINTPIITTSDAEGAGRCSASPRWTWPTCRARRTARSISAGLLRQGGLPDRLRPAQRRGFCLALSKVYTFGPTFRAENSNTARHLAEFWMIEPEIAFADLNDDADLAEAIPEVRVPGRAERAHATTEVLHRRARREDRDHAAEKPSSRRPSSGSTTPRR